MYYVVFGVGECRVCTGAAKASSEGRCGTTVVRKLKNKCKNVMSGKPEVANSCDIG